MAEEEKPKIIIDESWKAQVQREKEEARKRVEQQKEDKDAEAPSPEEKEELHLFIALLSGMATQAMLALGMIALRDTKEVVVDLDQAKHIIDTMMMLREKTAGNLAPDEEGHLKSMISELQRVYAARVQQAQEAALKNSGVDLNNLRKTK